MENSCPFVSRELLSRIPESKRLELEAYYSKISRGEGVEEDNMMQMMQVDGECPAARQVEEVSKK